MNQLMTKDLKSFYSYCNNQYQIYEFDKNLDGSLQSIEKRGLNDLKQQKDIFLGVKTDGGILFQSSKSKKIDNFSDARALAEMNRNLGSNVQEGHMHFELGKETYFGLYKYNANWKVFLVRAEEINEFYSESKKIFTDISIIIIAITAAISVIGIFILRYILRYMDIITSGIMRMVQNQQLDLIDLKGAHQRRHHLSRGGVQLPVQHHQQPGEHIPEVRQQGHRSQGVPGTPGDARRHAETDSRCFFTDIKSFTFITETLGHDIIKLLNLHYDRAIREIDQVDGVIGSIIGDALLAVYGRVRRILQPTSPSRRLPRHTRSRRLPSRSEGEDGEARKKRHCVRERGKLLPRRRGRLQGRPPRSGRGYRRRRGLLGNPGLLRAHDQHGDRRQRKLSIPARGPHPDLQGPGHLLRIREGRHREERGKPWARVRGARHGPGEGQDRIGKKVYWPIPE